MVVAFFRLLLVSAVADLAKAYQIVVDSDGELVVDSDGELVDESNAQEKLSQTLKILNSSDENVAWNVRTPAPKASASSSSNGTFLVGEAVYWTGTKRKRRVVIAVPPDTPDGKYSLAGSADFPEQKAVPSNELTKFAKTRGSYWMRITSQLRNILTPLKKALDASRPNEKAIAEEFSKIGGVLASNGLDPRFERWLNKNYRDYREPEFNIERASAAWTEHIELYRNYPVDRVHRVARDSWETGEPLECLWDQGNGEPIKAVVRGVNGHSDADIPGNSQDHGFGGSYIAGTVQIGTSHVMPDRVKFVGDSFKRIAATDIFSPSLESVESATMEELLSIFDFRKARERQTAIGASDRCCFHLLQSRLPDALSHIPFQKYAGDCRTALRPPVILREAPMECCEFEGGGQGTLGEILRKSEICFAIMLAEIELADYSNEATKWRDDQLQPLLATRLKGESCREWLLGFFATDIALKVHEAEGMLKMDVPDEALVMYFLQFQNIAFDSEKQASRNVKSISSSDGGHVYVIGDIHSSLASLLYIMKRIKEANPSDDEELPGWLICREGIFYVFLGDYVDRGDGADIEVITLILAYRVLCPLQETHGVLLLRGNHEDLQIQVQYGFMLAWLDRYHRLDYRLLEKSFGTMPIAGILNKEVLLTHGGLPPDFNENGEDHLFEEFNDVGGFIRFLNGWPTVLRVTSDAELANQNPLCIMLWADPRDEMSEKFAISQRGVGFRFGPQASDKLFKQAGIRYTIRGHEYSTESNVLGKPTEKHFSGHFSQHRTLTVFSAAEYHRPHHKYITPEIMRRLHREYDESEPAFGWKYPSSNGAYVEIKDGKHLKPIIHEFHEEVVYKKREGRGPDGSEVYAEPVCKHAFTIEQELGNPGELAQHRSLTPLVDSLVSDKVRSTNLDDASGVDVEALIPVECRGLDKARLIRNAQRELRNMTQICLQNRSSVEAYVIREEDVLGEAVHDEERGVFWNCVKKILRKALGQDEKVGQLVAKKYGEDQRASLEKAMKPQENNIAPAALVSPKGRSTKDSPGRGETAPLEADGPGKTIGGTSSAESLAGRKSPRPVVSPEVRSSALPKGKGGVPDITRKLTKEDWAKLPTFSAEGRTGGAADDLKRVHDQLDSTLEEMRARLGVREGGDSSTVGTSSVLQESYFSEPSMKVERDEVLIKNHVMNGADWIQDTD